MSSPQFLHTMLETHFLGTKAGTYALELLKPRDFHFCVIFKLINFPTRDKIDFLFFVPFFFIFNFRWSNQARIPLQREQLVPTWFNIFGSSSSSSSMINHISYSLIEWLKTWICWLFRAGYIWDSFQPFYWLSFSCMVHIVQKLFYITNGSHAFNCGFFLFFFTAFHSDFFVRCEADNRSKINFRLYELQKSAACLISVHVCCKFIVLERTFGTSSHHSPIIVNNEIAM